MENQIMETPQVEKKQKLKDLVFGKLKDGKYSQKDLQSILNAGSASVNQALRSLISENKISRQKEEINGKKKFIYSLV